MEENHGTNGETEWNALASPAAEQPDGHGLLLQVTPAGTKSWLFRYERTEGNGASGPRLPLHTVLALHPRERVWAARLQLLDGIDPLEAKAAVKQAAALAAAKALTLSQEAVRELSTQCYN